MERIGICVRVEAVVRFLSCPIPQVPLKPFYKRQALNSSMKHMKVETQMLLVGQNISQQVEESQLFLLSTLLRVGNGASIVRKYASYSGHLYFYSSPLNGPALVDNLLYFVLHPP